MSTAAITLAQHRERIELHHERLCWELQPTLDRDVVKLIQRIGEAFDDHLPLALDSDDLLTLGKCLQLAAYAVAMRVDIEARK